MSGGGWWSWVAEASAAVVAAAWREALFAGVVFAAVWVVCRVLRGASPRLHHGLWALVLLRLVLPVDLASPVSAGALLGRWSPWRVVAGGTSGPVGGRPSPPPALAHGRSGGVACACASRRAGFGDAFRDGSCSACSEPAGRDAHRPALLASGGREPEESVEALLSTPARWVGGGSVERIGEGREGVWAPAVVGLWAVGAGFVLGLLVRRRRFYRGALAGARPVAGGWVREAGERWRRRLGVRRAVAIVEGERRLPPFTAGVLRPVIYLPRALVARGGDAVEAAVGHEMAHVARLDAVWLALQNVVQVIWFFNPLARAAAARLGDARERAADELVLACGALPARRYAAGLVAALSLGLTAPAGPPPAPGLGTTKRRLSVRIEAILRRRPGGSKPLLPALACALAALLLLPLAAPADEPPPPPPAPAAAPAPEAPPIPEAPPVPAAPPALEVAPVPTALPTPQPPPMPAARPAPLATAAAPTPMAPPPPVPELANPVPEGRVSSGFGGRRDPKDGRSRPHEGLDLAAPAGAAVRASAAALVTVAAERYGEDGRLGRTVVLDHSAGLETLYAHLGSIAVAEGDRVEAGEVIGAVGSSGWVTGPHLHLEVRLDGRPADPAGRIPGLE